VPAKAVARYGFQLRKALPSISSWFPGFVSIATQKTERDIFQAAVLLAALGEKFPGAIETAVEDFPVSAHQYLVGALPFVLDLMQDHRRALEELSDAIARIEKA